MPKELNLEQFEQDLSENFSPEQREWLARLLHDHVSGLVTTLSMHIEIVYKMHSRNMMDKLGDEIASLKEEVSAASKHIVGIEKTIRPKREESAE